MEKIDIRLIAPFLLNCRDNFPQESSTFLKIMQFTYNVDATSVIINKREATKLYQKVRTTRADRTTKIKSILGMSETKCPNWPPDCPRLTTMSPKMKIGRRKARYSFCSTTLSRPTSPE